jgi:hypothetical protein
MAEPEVEAAWRAEFKRVGETQLGEALNSGGGFADEPKRQAAFRWLGEEVKRGGSGMRRPTTMSAGPSSPLSLP